MKNRSLALMFMIYLLFADLLADEITWKDTIARVSSAVVSIKIDSPKAFDTEWNTSSQATGFIVDAENGLILTNRHVVTTGPIRAEALFLNNEEIELTPIYRDPVHDFGFFKYNPDDLKYIKPATLKLSPEEAKVGQEIRVIGNDAGEKLSILAGTIARLDRQAPDYGRGNYNDFNTFYFQAASGTSGGSSGAPVINIQGNAVALNAGANNSSASSFFLPLDRIERALELIQKNQSITRGTLQTEFTQLTFDELKRLGLTPEMESLFRGQGNDTDGMLVVHRVIKESPIEQYLQPGDILLTVDEILIADFISLAEILDQKVNEKINVEVERGGKNISFMVDVTNLHDITPSSYLSFGDAIFNNFSYQQARHYNRSLEGVYVADPGYSLSRSAIPAGAVIFEIDGKSITTIEDLQNYLSQLTHQNKMNVRFVKFSDPINSVLRSVEVDRTWFKSEICIRNESNGSWPCQQLDTGTQENAQFTRSASFTKYKESLKNKIAPSLVHVTFDLPYPVAGIVNRHYYGTGLLVDKENGLVIVDRNTVPLSMGDIRLTFAGSLEISGKVEFIHPLHNLAIVKYDPDLIGDTLVREAKFNTKPLEAGDEASLSGLKVDHQLFHQKVTVSSIDPLILPPSIKFSDTNIEVIDLVNAPDDIYGVLTDKKGNIRALWTSFAYRSGGETLQINRGISSDLISEFIAQIKEDKPLYSLDLDLGYIPLFSARKMGLSDEWINKFELINGRRLMIVNNRISGSPASKVIQNGDIILSINNQLISSFRDYEKFSQSKSITVNLWRQNKLLEYDIDTELLNGNDIDHVLIWAGAHLHEPHRTIAQRGIDPSGVYVAFSNYGSPATRYGLKIGQRIVAVNEIDTPTLDDFIHEIRDKKDRSSLRLKTIAWNGATKIITMKLDNEFWSPYELKKISTGWQRSIIN
ncbi:trypsin-like peptidase domain-containing protein [Woeseiaceae bacterium]|nr:trypsin-like peptidase domain-containing protein [Woeseiaceae bacterium]